jgi:hypothetical protein
MGKVSGNFDVKGKTDGNNPPLPQNVLEDATSSIPSSKNKEKYGKKLLIITTRAILGKNVGISKIGFMN